MKVKVIANWQTNEQMQDSFVHTIRKLQHGENNVQTPNDHNGPLQSNWVGLTDSTHQPVTSQPLVKLST
jgi:hypothetical protein